MKELLTAIEYNLGMLALRIRKVREEWDSKAEDKADPPVRRAGADPPMRRARAEEKLKKVNELLYEVSDLIEKMESEGEL